MNDYSEILNFLSEEIGLNIDSIGLISITSSITALMKEKNINNSVEFFKLIKSDYEFFRLLIENIKVPETWFFRDLECYNFLNNYFVEHSSKFTQAKPIRILSIPCSTGEEPYSIAMSALDNGLSKDEVQILAVDISQNSIKFARNGLFRNNSFRNNYKDFAKRYFQKINNDYKIIDKVKELVSFEEANFVKNDFLQFQNKFEIIFCKNLLIYLNDEARSIVLNNINRLLSDTGVLLVGLSEINFFTRNGYEQIKFDMAFACRKSNNTNKFANNIAQSNNLTRVIAKQNIIPVNIVEKYDNKLQIKSQADDLKEKYTISNIRKLSNEGNFVEAEKICNTILKSEAYNVEILFYLGLINNALEKSSLALDYFNKVVYLKPDHYESLIHLSLLYDSLGNKNQSEIYRKRAEKIYSKINHNSELQ